MLEGLVKQGGVWSHQPFCRSAEAMPKGIFYPSFFYFLKL